MKALILLLIAAATCVGQEPKFFVEFDVQGSDPTHEFRGKNLLLQEGGAEFGIGAQIAAGLELPSIDAYAGFATARHEAKAQSEIWFFGSEILKANGDWNIQQWLLGVRVHPIRAKWPVLPVVGFATTSSTVTADATVHAFGDTSSVDDKSSAKQSFMVEGGGYVRTGRLVDLLFLIQFHDFDATFENELWDGTLNITYARFSAGIKYRLN